MKKKLFLGLIAPVVVTAAMPLAISMNTNVDSQEKVSNNKIFVINISKNPLKDWPTKIALYGTNGYARVIEDLNQNLRPTFFRVGKEIKTPKHLQNEDIVRLTYQSGEKQGQFNEYKVQGLTKTVVTPYWPRTYSELQTLIQNGGDDYFNYVLSTDVAQSYNAKIKVYKAVVKDHDIFAASPAFTQMAYLDGGDNITSWVTSGSKGKATIWSWDQSTKFKSSLGEYNYGDINAHINTGRIYPASGFTASADLDKALLYLKFYDTGKHKFGSVRAEVSDVMLKIYDANNHLKSTTYLPNQGITLFHKSSNWFTGLLSTLDPVSAIVQGAMGLGALIAGGFNEKGVEWAKAFSGYDQNSELAKIASWVNMGIGIVGDILTIPLTGGISATKSITSGLIRAMKGANLLKKISLGTKVFGYTFRSLSKISEAFNVTIATAEVIQNLVENPGFVSMTKFLKSTLGMSNLAMEFLFSKTAGQSAKTPK